MVGNGGMQDGSGAKVVAVLAYHKIGPPAKGGWETWNYVPTEVFSQQLARVKALGYDACVSHSHEDMAEQLKAA